jgi:hypothetical protein
MAERIEFLDGFRPVNLKVLRECAGEAALKLVSVVTEAPMHMSEHFNPDHFPNTGGAPMLDEQLALDLTDSK